VTSDFDSAQVGATNPVLRRMLHYVWPHKKVLALAFVLLFIGTAANVLPPILIKVFIDRFLSPHRFPEGPLIELGAAYMGLYVLTAGLSLWQLVLFQGTALKIIQQLRIDVFAKVQTLGLAFFDRTPTGQLVSRITNDTEAIKDMYVNVMSSFVQNTVLLIGILLSMFILNPVLGGFCALFLPIVVLIMYVYRRVSSRIFHTARHRLSLLNAKLSESLQGMYIVQALRQQDRLRKEFGHINNAYRQSRLANIKNNSFFTRPLIDVVYLLGLMLVLGYFGVRSLGGAVDIGTLYVFVNYLERFFEPVNDMMQRLNSFQQASVASQRVFRLLDEDSPAPAQVGSGNPTINDGLVTFENVSFSYDGVTDVLRNVSFTAKPGQTVALVGHTGSGKSTIANLLLRFYPVTRGSISIDGVYLDQFSDDELRKRVGLVLQDSFLFVGTVMSNIRLGNDLSDEQVQAAARFVQADRFIQRLPHGYDEPLGERGATLSSGERQLLAFARTMAIDPRILVLDEATASIDTETEEAIQEALGRMRRGRTTIAIAHRLSTIQDADLILVLHHGEIVERGTHQSLLALQGLYHKMFLLQQGGRAALEVATQTT